MFTFPLKEQYRRTQGFAEKLLDYSRFGMKGHNGVDYAAFRGSGLYSVARGKVSFVEKKYAAGDTSGYGNMIALLIPTDRPNQFYDVVYGHLLTAYGEVGQEVEAGQLVGLVNSTGFSTGDHLHFGVRIVERRTPNQGEVSRLYFGAQFVIKDYHNGYFGYINPEPLFIQAPLREVLAVDLRYGQAQNKVLEAYWELVHGAYARRTALKHGVTVDDRLVKAFIYGKHDALTNTDKRHYGILDNVAFYFTAMTMTKMEFLKRIGKPRDGTNPFGL